MEKCINSISQGYTVFMYEVQDGQVGQIYTLHLSYDIWNGIWIYWFIIVPFPDLQFQIWNLFRLPETLPPPESSHHHTHELTFLLLDQSHGPLMIKSQLNEKNGKKNKIIINTKLLSCNKQNLTLLQTHNIFRNSSRYFCLLLFVKSKNRVLKAHLNIDYTVNCITWTWTP